MEASKEIVFYQDTSVTVTQTRFVSNSKTYAMSNISSVSLGRIKRSRLLEILLVVIGLIVAVSEDTVIVGVILVALGVLLFFLLKDSYSVRVNSNSGETDGFISQDKAMVSKIVGAR